MPSPRGRNFFAGTFVPPPLPRLQECHTPRFGALSHPHSAATPSQVRRERAARLANPGDAPHLPGVIGEKPLAPILITDDESEDRFFLEKALRKAGCKNPIIEFRDGAELLEFLEREAGESKSPGEVATLLFLDIKMPLVDGFDAMRWIRSHPIMKVLRIVIVSSSSLPRDQEEASQLGALRYLEKYPTSEALANVMAGCAGPN